MATPKDYFFSSYLSDCLDGLDQKIETSNFLLYQPVIRADDFFKFYSRLKNFISDSPLENRLIINSSGLIQKIADFLGVGFFIQPGSDNKPDELEKFLYPLFLVSILKEKEIIENFFRFSNFSDEPKLFIYGAKVKSPSHFSIYGSGASLNKEKAVWSSIGEAVERYCLAHYKKSDFLKTSYNKLKNSAFNPNNIVAFSVDQKKQENFQLFNFDENSLFYWVKGYSLTRERSVYVPAQLSYFWKYEDNEPIIRYYVTTGASSSQQPLKEAIYRGICETIERDAFMIFYLNRLPPPRMNLAVIKDDDIQKILANFERYNLELHLLEITTDIPVPVFLAAIIDRTGIGPAVVIGAKASLDVKEGALGAIEEAWSSRINIRKQMASHLEFFGPTPPPVIGREDRLLFWARQEMITKIDFFLRGKTKNQLPDQLEISTDTIDRKIDWLVTKIKEKGEEIIYVDISSAEIKRIGFSAVQVIIPGLQPLYLDERYPYLGGKRLRDVPVILGYKDKPDENFNPIPHPFP